MKTVQQSILKMLLLRPLTRANIRGQFFGQGAMQGNALIVLDKLIEKGLVRENQHGVVELTSEGYKAAAPDQPEPRKYTPYTPPKYIRRPGSSAATELPSCVAGKLITPRS